MLALFSVKHVVRMLKGTTALELFKVKLLQMILWIHILQIIFKYLMD